MSYSLEFEIQALPKMSNSLLRQHFWVIKREKDRWLRLVSEVTLGKIPSKPLERVRIDYTRFSSKEPDRDGNASGFKFVQDSLVKLRIIVDDKPSVIREVNYHWEWISPKSGKISVSVVEK